MEKRLSQLWTLRMEGAPPYQRWLKYAIILGVLFSVFVISILVALRPNSRVTLLIVALPAVALLAVLLLRKTVLGILGVILACMFVPAFLSGGAGALLSPPLMLLVVTIVIWILDMLVRQHRIRLIRSRVVLAAFVFLIVSLIAFLNGQINYYSFAQIAPITAQVGGMAVFVLAMGALLLAAHLIEDIKWLERITWLFLIVGAVYIILGRVVPFTGRFIRPRFAYGSTDGASSFWIWLAAMAFSQALFNRKLDKRLRIGLFGLVIAEITVAIVQAYDWKSGWVPAVIAILVILWVGFPRIRIPAALVAVVAVGLNHFININNVVAGNEDYSILTREVAQRLVLEIAKVNPILGLGFSNYYFYTPLFPILGYRVQFNSHNNYVDIIAQTGLVGMVVFLWLAAEICVVGWNLQKRVPDGFPKAYTLGVLGGVIGMLVSGLLGDWMLPFVYNVGLTGFRASLFGWLFIGGLIALEGMYLNSRASRDAD
jgi:O-Antigen ligase